MNKIINKILNINTEYSEETCKKIQNEIKETKNKKNKDEFKNSINNIWNLIKKYKYLVLTAIIIAIISILVSVVVNLKIQPLVDLVIKNEMNEVYTKLVPELAILLLVLAITMFLSSSIMAVLSQVIVYNLRNKTFDHLQKLEIKFFDTRNSGSIISTFVNDIELLSTALDQSIAKSILSIIKIIIVSIALIYINPLIGILLLVISSIYFYAMYIFSKKAKIYTELKQEYLSKLNGYSEEMISAMSMLKTNNATSIIQKEFEKKAEYLRYLEEKSQLYGGLVYEITSAFRYFTYMILAFVGGNLAINNIITVGTIVTYISMIRQLTDPAMELSTQITTLLSAMSGTNRVFEILNEDTEDFSGDVEIVIKDNKKYWNDNGNLIEAKGYIEVENVKFGYTDDKEILKGISLYAKPGQKIAFIGATGAGKTTIINLLNRFYNINSGKITIDSIDITRISKNVLRSQITTVLQDTNIFTGTILDNIRNGNFNATDEEIIEACIKTRANIFIEKLENKYNTIINPDETKLSQGELQLISITRALISKPLVLILDEATSSVDSNTEKLVTDAMDIIMKQSTSLVIAHRLSTIQNSKAILLIENGEIVERGEHEQLMELKGKYYELYTGKTAIV